MAALGSEHTCIIGTKKSVHCYGWNYYGQSDVSVEEVEVSNADVPRYVPI